MEVREIDTSSEVDIPGLSELFREYSLEAKVEISPKIANELSGLPFFRGFIVFKNDKPVAFSVCFESYSTYRSMFVWNIHDFMVSKSVRGLGIGKQLLEFILLQAKKSNVVKLVLEVNDGNHAAMNLYKSLGFKDYREKAPKELHWQVYTGNEKVR